MGKQLGGGDESLVRTSMKLPEAVYIKYMESGATERRIHGFLFFIQSTYSFHDVFFLSLCFYGGQQDSKAEVSVNRSG